MQVKMRYCFSFLVLAFYLFFSNTYLLAEPNIKVKNANKKSNAKVYKQKKASSKKSVNTAKKENKPLKYTIKRGDTIQKIAKLKGLTEKDILALNTNINPKRLKPGQILFIPNKSCDIAKKDLGKNNNIALHSSRKYSVGKEEIRSLENFGGNNITPADYNEEDEDYEGDEEVPTTENLSLIEQKRDIQLYSLREDGLKRLINNALDYVGATYKYGGDNIASMDCSAFVRRVFKEVNINLPRTSREQYTLGLDVNIEDLKEGDLIFFAKKKRINHVGIYIGNNMYIHAARKGKGVIVSNLDSPYVKKYFAGAKRLFTIESASNIFSKEKLIN